MDNRTGSDGMKRMPMMMTNGWLMKVAISSSFIMSRILLFPLSLLLSLARIISFIINGTRKSLISSLALIKFN